MNRFKSQSGQDLVEYALLVAMLAFGAVAAIGSLSTEINTAFNTISAQVDGALHANDSTTQQ